MAGGTLVPTRDQLKRWCTDNDGTDEDLLRKIEQVFFGVDDIPALQDGVDDNTLSIATLSDLVRPITVDLIRPLSSTVASNTTYNLTPAQSTEGMKTIFIPSAFLIAAAGGPFTLTITTGAGTTAIVAIAASSDAINSGDLMFDVHVDATGNVVAKDWSFIGSNSNGTYEIRSDGLSQQFGKTTNDTASAGVANYFGSTSGNMAFDDTPITFPFPFIGGSLPSVAVGQMSNITHCSPLTINATGFTLRFLDTAAFLINSKTATWQVVGPWR